MYAHVHCAMPRAKKGQPKKTRGLCPSRSYYSIVIPMVVSALPLYVNAERGGLVVIDRERGENIFQLGNLQELIL